MGSRCYECAEINGYCDCPDRAIYNQKSMDNALSQLREQIAKEVAMLRGFELGMGESIHSGFGLHSKLEGAFLSRIDVLQAIRGK